MSKSVLNSLVFFVLLVFCVGFGGCTYKPLVSEERETAWNYDWISTKCKSVHQFQCGNGAEQMEGRRTIMMQKAL